MEKQTLTRKQSKYVDGVVEHGNGTRAVLDAYETNDPIVAKSISSENLTKPYIVKEIASRLSEGDIDKAHESLITAVRLDYFVFPTTMQDDEIKDHVEAQGLTLLNVRKSDRGKLAFFTLPDGASRGKGIELWHKIHGTFAPEKKLVAHVTVEPNDRIKRLADRLNGQLQAG